MFKKNIYFLVFFCLVSALLFGGLNVSYSHAQLDTLKVLEKAGDAAYGASDAEQMRNEDYVSQVIGRIINIFLSVLGAIFLILLIYSGAMWMMAGGNEERISKAKQTISRAIIGLIIIAASYGIAHFVIQSIVKSTTGTG